MITDVAIVSSRMAVSTDSLLSDGSGRQACPPRQTRRAGETVQRQPGERAETQRPDEVEDGLKTGDRDRSGCAGRSDFKETLKKRVQCDDGHERQKDKDSEQNEMSQGAVVEAAAVFRARGDVPMSVKAAATGPDDGASALKKQADGTGRKLNMPVAVRIGKAPVQTMQKPADTKDTANVTPQPTARPHRAFVEIKAPIQQRQGVPQDPLKAEKLVSQVGGKATEQPAEAGKAEKADSVQTIENSARHAIEKLTSILNDAKDQSAVQRAIDIDTVPRAEKTAPVILRLSKNTTDSANKKEDKPRLLTLKDLNQEDSGPTQTEGKSSKLAEIDNARHSRQVYSSQSTSHTQQSGRVSEAGESVAEAASSTPNATNPSSVSFDKGTADVGAARPIDQIVQTLQLRTFGAESQVRMMLAPESLGAIRLTFQQSQGQVLGLLEVQKTETRKEIERSVGQLTASMEAAGVQIRRIEVVPWTSNSQPAKGDLAGQEFDTPDQRQMYRSAGEETTRHSAKKDATDPSATSPQTPEKTQRNEIAPPETALNFYL